MRRIKPGVVSRVQWALTQRRPKRPLPFLRLLWHDFVIHGLFEGGERCQTCGRDYVLWNADSALYRSVHGSPYGLLCPSCFDREARELGLTLDWRPVVVEP